VFRRPHYQFRTLQVQPAHVFEKSLFILVGIFLDALVLGCGILNDPIIHVCNVHDVLEFEAALTQEPPQNIDGYKCAEIANVGIVIHGRTAGIHANGIVSGRSKLFHLAGKRVVESERQTEIVAKERRANGAVEIPREKPRGL